MSIENVVANIKRDYFSTDLAVGKTVEHPDHGTVQILSGCFWDPTYARLSNWWTWAELVDGQPTGPQHSGYGWM